MRFARAGPPRAVSLSHPTRRSTLHDTNHETSELEKDKAMPSEFSIPTTISAEAQEAMNAFELKWRNFELPERDDIAGWRRTHAKLEAQFAARNDAVVETYNPRIEQLELGGVPCLDIKPSTGTDDARTIVYVHGGGFAVFSARSTLTSAVPVAADTGVRVVSVDYTVAPHATWRQIIDSVIAVVRALIAEGTPLEQIAIFGDSAGGSIASGVVLKMRDDGYGIPAAVVLWSPWSDITHAGDTYETLQDADPLLFWPKNLEHCAAAYAPAGDQRHPYVSPVYADYAAGFPPTLIQVGTKEIFLSDAVRHYRALDNAGIDVTLDVYEGMWHVFQAFNPDIPESKAARRKMATFLHAHL